MTNGLLDEPKMLLDEPKMETARLSAGVQLPHLAGGLHGNPRDRTRNLRRYRVRSGRRGERAARPGIPVLSVLHVASSDLL